MQSSLLQADAKVCSLIGSLLAGCGGCSPVPLWRCCRVTQVGASGAACLPGITSSQAELMGPSNPGAGLTTYRRTIGIRIQGVMHFALTWQPVCS